MATVAHSPADLSCTRLLTFCPTVPPFVAVIIQIEGEEAQRLTKHRLEREKARKDATADMSEDLSEGERVDTVSDISSHGDCTRSRMPRISSVDAIEGWASQHKDKKLYIVLIRHGTGSRCLLILFSVV